MRSLRNLQLNDRDLPWVGVAKHLGCKVRPNNQGSINRVNELKEEFSYAHPLTKIMTNKVFNTHFYESQLWDLFTQEAGRLEKTWNISGKNDVRRATKYSPLLYLIVRGLRQSIIIFFLGEFFR